MPVCTCACRRGWLSLESTTVLMNLLVAGQLFKRNQHKIFPQRAIVLWFIACITCDLSGSMFVFFLSEFGSWAANSDGHEKLWDVKRGVEPYDEVLWVKATPLLEENWRLQERKSRRDGLLCFVLVEILIRFPSTAWRQEERGYNQSFSTKKEAGCLESTAVKTKSRFLAYREWVSTDINKQNVREQVRVMGARLPGHQKAAVMAIVRKWKRRVEGKTGMCFGVLFCLQDVETGIILTCGDVSGLLGKGLWICKHGNIF